jgi:hypothetical protein
MKLKLLENKGAETATLSEHELCPYCNELNHPQLLLAKLTNKQEYKNSIKGYVDYLIKTQQKTPKGLLFISKWGSLRHAANAASVMLQVNFH